MEIVLLHAIATDGTDYDLLPGGSVLWDIEHFPEIREGKLIFSVLHKRSVLPFRFEIISPEELAAVLFFGYSELYYGYGGMDDDVYKLFHDPNIIFPMFSYLCGSLTSSQLMEQLTDVMELRPFLKLKSKKDEESFERAFMGILTKVMGVPSERDQFIDRYVALARKSKTLADISRLELTYVSESGRDRLGDEYYRLQKIQKTEHFTAVPKGNSSYNQAYKKWLNILKDNVLSKNLVYSPSPETLVRKALASGDIYDLLPAGYHSDYKTVCDLSKLTVIYLNPTEIDYAARTQAVEVDIPAAIPQVQELPFNPTDFGFAADEILETETNSGPNSGLSLDAIFPGHRDHG